MSTPIFYSLDKQARVVRKNFWYTVEVLSGGIFRPQCSSRSQEVACNICGKVI